MDVQGLVFDIQGFSVHDGPGCRSLVFLSGCPLRCEWCANPEGMQLQRRFMYSAQKCKHRKSGCVRCIKVCPRQAIADGDDDETPLKFDRLICDKCESRECVAACYHEAARLSGNWLGVEELTGKLKRDACYWGDVGGVTFSGGEPLLQHDFLLAALKACKAAKIHTCIETTAHAPTEIFLKAFANLDFAFIDVKHMNSAEHQKKTGVGNALILRNIRQIKRSGWPGRLILRMPVIKDYNDSRENIKELAEFMREIGQVELNALPFHRLGDSKWTQLGQQYQYGKKEAASSETLEWIQNYLLEEGIVCYIGHEVLY